jgi:anti-sigma B factor antagonist
MRVTVQERAPGAYLVKPQGEVDMSTSPELRKVLVPLFCSGTRLVLVDLTEVPYMDSSGIATLVEGLQLSQRGSIRFALAGLSPPVRAAFEVAHLMEVFKVVSQVDHEFQEGFNR